MQRLERAHAIVTLTGPGSDSLAIHSTTECVYHSCGEEDTKTQCHEEYVRPEDAIDGVECDGLSRRQLLVMVFMGSYQRNKQRKKRKERQWSRYQWATHGHRGEKKKRREERTAKDEKGGLVDRSSDHVCDCVSASNSGGGRAKRGK